MTTVADVLDAIAAEQRLLHSGDADAVSHMGIEIGDLVSIEIVSAGHVLDTCIYLGSTQSGMSVRVWDTGVQKLVTSFFPWSNVAVMVLAKKFSEEETPQDAPASESVQDGRREKCFRRRAGSGTLCDRDDHTFGYHGNSLSGEVWS